LHHQSDDLHGDTVRVSIAIPQSNCRLPAVRDDMRLRSRLMPLVLISSELQLAMRPHPVNAN